MSPKKTCVQHKVCNLSLFKSAARKTRQHVVVGKPTSDKETAQLLGMQEADNVQPSECLMRLGVPKLMCVKHVHGLIRRQPICAPCKHHSNVDTVVTLRCRRGISTKRCDVIHHMQGIKNN
jgi:hypothetical protein